MTGAAPIRILVVDDHAVVRAGLRLLLDREDDLEVVAEAGDADAGVRAARLEKPDVILLDVVMPGRSGIEVAAELIEASKGAKVLVLSMQDDPSYVREAFAGGASGYLLKEAADSELVAAIRTVAGGGTYLQPEVGAKLLVAGEPQASTLTRRETEVLRLIALGHTSAEIAASLYLSVRTVETHRSNIHAKLRVSRRADLVRYALERRLIAS